MNGEFGLRLSECLKEFGLTQRELADSLRINEVTVSRWIKGVSMPAYATVERIANIFGMPAKYFFLITEDLFDEIKDIENGVIMTVQISPSEYRKRELDKSGASKKENEAKTEGKNDGVNWGAILTGTALTATAVIGIVALAKAMGKLTDKDTEQIKDILDR